VINLYQFQGFYVYVDVDEFVKNQIKHVLGVKLYVYDIIFLKEA